MSEREDFFTQFQGVLKIEFASKVAMTFFENLRRSNALLALPTLMFGFLQVEHEFQRIEHEVLTRNWGGTLTQYIDDLQKARESLRVSQLPDMYQKTKKRFEEALNNPTYGPTLRASTEVLRSSAVISAWSAFEFLATDLWVSAVDDGPQRLAQSAFSNLEENGSDISSKQISVGLAARHGFDLRNCLGSILKPKFEFSNLEGLRKAYKIFGKDPQLEEELRSPTLIRLEAARHVLVHRAGRVDEEYRRKAHSEVAVGEMLVFSDLEVDEFFNTVTRVGIFLIAFVHDWVVEGNDGNKMEVQDTGPRSEIVNNPEAVEKITTE